VGTSRPLQDDDCCIDPREVPGAVRREMIGPEFRSGSREKAAGDADDGMDQVAAAAFVLSADAFGQ
jgi:hypothetical protein